MECVGKIGNWMWTGTLALKDRKTEVINFSCKFYGLGPVT